MKRWVANGIALTAAAAVTFGCGDNDPALTPEQHRAEVEAAFVEHGVTALPGSIVRIEHIEGLEESIDASTRWLTDYITKPVNVSAGSLFVSGKDLSTRVYDGDAIGEGEAVHVHTAKKAPCAELIFDNPVAAVLMVSSRDGYAAQVSNDGSEVVICDETPTSYDSSVAIDVTYADNVVVVGE